MANDTHPSPLAVAYAQAMLELATESNSAPTTGEELNDLRQIIQTTPGLEQVLANPTISAEERGRLIDDAFKGRVSQLVYDLLRLANEKGRLSILTGIADAYDELLDEKYGKIEVDVTSAQALSAAEAEQVRKKVSDSLKRDAVVHQYVDESIIGGLILRVQDQLIDGSVRAQLQNMRNRLLAATPQG